MVANAARQRAGLDTRALVFTADMYGLPLDQLAELQGGITVRQARALVARWARDGLAESERLGPGPAWVWLTRSGLRACGVRYSAGPPALARLAHIRAVTAVRLAFEAASGYREASGYWRSERRLRARLGGRVGTRDHLPDAEVHWPDGTAVSWAGECWAIEAELTAKTVARTTAIMRELLARTGDYGCAAAEARVPGLPPRHTSVIYLCSPAATGTVLRARDALGSLGARIEVRELPPGADMSAASAPAARTATASAPAAPTGTGP
jgi:hypothetical protein